MSKFFSVVGEDEKKHRKHELIKKVVKKMDLDGAITPEEVRVGDDSECEGVRKCREGILERND